MFRIAWQLASGPTNLTLIPYETVGEALEMLHELFNEGGWTVIAEVGPGVFMFRYGPQVGRVSVVQQERKAA